MNTPGQFLKLVVVLSAFLGAAVLTTGCGNADDPTTDGDESSDSADNGDGNGGDNEDVDSTSDALSKPFPNGQWNPNEGIQRGKPCGAKIKKKINSFPCAQGTVASGVGFCVLVCFKPKK